MTIPSKHKIYRLKRFILSVSKTRGVTFLGQYDGNKETLFRFGSCMIKDGLEIRFWRISGWEIPPSRSNIWFYIILYITKAIHCYSNGVFFTKFDVNKRFNWSKTCVRMLGTSPNFTRNRWILVEPAWELNFFVDFMYRAMVKPKV
jgi:hypothetical protein